MPTKHELNKEVNDSLLNCKNCDSSRLCVTEGQRRQELFSEVEEKTDEAINVVNASSIEILPKLAKVAVNDMINFKIEQKPFTSNAPEVTWETSDSKIATVDQNGILYTHTKGSVVLKATDSIDINKPVKAELKLGVVDGATSLTLDHKTGEVTVNGGTLTLKATIGPKGADQDVVWSSSNEKVATVEGGVVTAVEAAEDTIVEITAKSLVGSASDVCKVTVHPALPA